MSSPKTIQEFRLSKPYLVTRLQKYLKKGIFYHYYFPQKQISKMKELGLIMYNDKKQRYDIIMDVYNKLKGEIDNE